MDWIPLETDCVDFFNILPNDWRDLIVPIWDDYQHKAVIYVFKNTLVVSAGGIVFKGAPPNSTCFEKTNGQTFVDSGFHYIGFLFVNPNYRNQALGTKWLTTLKDMFPNQSYWLTIEEEGLLSFYQKNGFKKVAVSEDKAYPEWILIYEP